MVRVIVGEAPGARSGLWRIFTHGDDIYVQHDGLRRDLKTSLHASGANHVAWTASGAARWTPDGDRYMMRWGEPKDFTPGGKNLLRILIPTDHLTVPEEEPPLAEREKITLLAPAPAGDAMVLTVVRTPPDTQLTSREAWAVLASWPLPTRGTVWVVANTVPWERFREGVAAALPQMRDQFEANLGDTLRSSDREEGRAVLWTDLDPAGVAQMIEVGLEFWRR
jgi:hypothetical protein